MQTTSHDCCQPWASSSGKTYSSLAITSWWNRSWKNDTEEEYLTNVQRSLSTFRLITFCSQVAFQFFMLSLLGELTGNGLNCIVNGPNNKVSKWLGWKRFSSSIPAWLIGCYLPPRCRWVKLPELSSVCIPMQLVRSLHTGNWRLVEPHVGNDVCLFFFMAWQHAGIGFDCHCEGAFRSGKYFAVAASHACHLWGGPFDDPDVLPSIVCSVLSCMLYLQLRHASNKSRPGGAYLLTCQQRFLLGHLAASASQWFTKFLTRKNPVVGHWEVTQEQNACCWWGSILKIWISRCTSATVILACKQSEICWELNQAIPCPLPVIKELHRLSGNAISMRSLYVALSTIRLAMDPIKLRGYLNGW